MQLSVLINTNLLRTEHKVKYFFPQAHVHNGSKQSSTFVDGLKEEDAYPAMPEDGYGWENYLVKECVNILKILT